MISSTSTMGVFACQAWKCVVWARLARHALKIVLGHKAKWVSYRTWNPYKKRIILARRTKGMVSSHSTLSQAIAAPTSHPRTRFTFRWTIRVYLRAPRFRTSKGWFLTKALNPLNVPAPGTASREARANLNTVIQPVRSRKICRISKAWTTNNQ